MKKILLTTICVLSLKTFALINSVDSDLKLVNWTPTNTLEVNTTVVNQDVNNYAILSYSWNVRYEDVDAETAKIKSSYPSYSLERNDLESIENLRFIIADAGFELVLTALPSQNGFYTENNVIITQSQYQAITKAKNSNPTGYVSLSGRAHTHMKVVDLLETKMLTPQICQSLYGTGTLGEVMSREVNYSQQLQSNCKNPQTARLFISAIQNSCFAPAQSQTVTSMQDLLNVKMKVILSQNFPVNFVTSKSVPLDMNVPFILGPWQSK
jgi:hypothetical protein